MINLPMREHIFGKSEVIHSVLPSQKWRKAKKSQKTKDKDTVHTYITTTIRVARDEHKSNESIEAQIQSEN